MNSDHHYGYSGCVTKPAVSFTPEEQERFNKREYKPCYHHYQPRELNSKRLVEAPKTQHRPMGRTFEITQRDLNRAAKARAAQNGGLNYEQRLLETLRNNGGSMLLPEIAKVYNRDSSWVSARLKKQREAGAIEVTKTKRNGMIVSRYTLHEVVK